MPLDPNDPLIPLPWQMDSIRAYRASKQAEAERQAMRDELLRLQLSKAERETPQAQIDYAAGLAAQSEKMRQAREGVQFGDIAREAALDKGMNLLQASRAQGEADILSEADKARRQAMLGQMMKVMPTEKYSYEGVSGEALQGQGAAQMSSTRRKIFQQDYNDFYDANIVRGMDPQQAHENAVDSAVEKQKKDQASGKVQIMLPGLGNLTTTPKELNRMMADPNTPQNVKDAIKNQWGTPGQLSVKDYLKSKLGR